MRAGDAIWNPLTGEKAVIVESAEETGGTRIVVEFAVEAGGFVPGGEHVHDHCAEHVEIRTGRITFVLDGAKRTLRRESRSPSSPGPGTGGGMAVRARCRLAYASSRRCVFRR